MVINITVDQIKQLIKKLPHSETRVPYTYHHDYVRCHVVRSTGVPISRSEVAEIQNWSELELYAVALCQLLTDVGIQAFELIALDDLRICKQSLEVCRQYMPAIAEALYGEHRFSSW